MFHRSLRFWFVRSRVVVIHFVENVYRLSNLLVLRLFAYSYGVGKSKTSKRCRRLAQHFGVDCGTHHKESDSESQRYGHRVQSH